jgi:ABC-type dipeptide/oligopeptide/nickel transport system permease component
MLAFGMMASKAKIIRSSLIEVLEQEYITTAYSKELSKYKIILKHAFINALIPIITILSLQTPILIGGAFIVEEVFACTGLDRVFINAALEWDFLVIMGITVFMAIAVTCINLLTDILNAVVDLGVKYDRVK